MSELPGKASFLHYGSEESFVAGSNTMITERKVPVIGNNGDSQSRSGWIAGSTPTCRPRFRRTIKLASRGSALTRSAANCACRWRALVARRFGGTAAAAVAPTWLG
jgi:hypothetical protein